MLRFVREVEHPNLTVILDTGQFLGSPGASAEVRKAPGSADLYESIQEVAPVACYVRAKIYNFDASGREQWLDYDRIFNILRSVHYHGIIDIVYEGKGRRKDRSSSRRKVLAALPHLKNCRGSHDQCTTLAHH